MTGNTLGLSKESNANGPGLEDSIGTFVTVDTTSTDNDPANPANPWPAGTTSNWRNNGASAVLELTSDAEVLYAELVWAGSYADASENVRDQLDSPVTLQAATGASTLVRPEGVSLLFDGNAPVGGFAIRYYLRSQEVTDFIRQHGGGEYTVLGVPATQSSQTNSLNAAGWTLVVAYRSTGAESRNLSIFVGGEFVDEQSIVDYEVSGFCSPPSGPVSGRVVVSALEGDADLAGDQMLIADPVRVMTEGSAAFGLLEGANNRSDNFFGSQINGSDGMLDTRGTFGDRNHDAMGAVNASGARQGWDVTRVAVSNDPSDGQLGNAQTAAVIRATSQGDSFLPLLVAFEIDVNAPEFENIGISEISSPTTYEGDELVYTVRLTNQGQADATGAIYTMALPEGLTLLEFTLDGQPGDGAGNPVTATELANGVSIGTVPFGREVVAQTRVRVDALPEFPAPATFVVVPQWSYNYVSCSDSEPLGGSISADALRARAARLEMVLSAQPLGSGRVRYTAIATNTGSAPTAGATLEVAIPQGASYVEGSTQVNDDVLPDRAGMMPFVGGGSISSPGSAAGVIGPDERATVIWEVVLDALGEGATLDARSAIDPDGSGPAPEVEATLMTTIGQCGDGVLSGVEQCDDGNTTSNDGCSSCRVDPGFACHGEPSVCDEDSDNDGLSDRYEDEVTQTDPNDADSDDDGLDDGTEVLGENPTNPTDADSDDDGLCDGPAADGATDGICAGGSSGEDQNADGAQGPTETDPNAADTDGGTVPDGEEVERGTNPLDPSDDIPADRDGDGLVDAIEEMLGTSPTEADSDGDGLCDGPNAVEGVCEPGEDLNMNGQVDDGETDPTRADSDGDNLTDGTELLGDNPTD
ncbi:MAG: DUF4215 domain-containing protein, partial [Myxococcota bacterium]